MVKTKEGMSIFHLTTGTGQKEVLKELMELGDNPE